MPASNPASARACVEELERHRDIAVRDGPPVGAARGRRHDPPGARGSPSAPAADAGPADEDALTARRLPDSAGVERPGDGQGVDGRRQPRMPVHVEVRVVRLALGLDERAVLAQKRGADVVRSGADPRAQLQMLVDAFVRVVVAHAGCGSASP